MEEERKRDMDLKNSHKSKKAPAKMLKLNADRETAIHTTIIHYLVHQSQGETP